MSQESITIPFSKDFPRFKAEDFGLEHYQVHVVESGRFTYTGRKPGPGEVYGAFEVGLVAAGSGVLAAAITGVCAYLSSRAGRKAVVKGANGRSIEFPMNATNEQIRVLIELAKAMDAKEIVIGTPVQQTFEDDVEPKRLQGEKEHPDDLADDSFFP